MRTNIEIDDKLMKQAMKVTGLPTKKATVEHALKQLLELQKQVRIINSLHGKYPDWGRDYEKMR